MESAKYADTQNRVYWIDADTGKIQRWGAKFGGHLAEYTPMKGDALLTAGMVGTEVQLYTFANAGAGEKKISPWPGSMAVSPIEPELASASPSLTRA